MAREDIERILSTLQTDTAEFNADDFRTALLSAYDEDISVRDTAVRERESSLTSAKAEIDKWKLKNYDLLQKIPADPAGTQTPGQSKGTDTANETNVSLEDLFRKE